MSNLLSADSSQKTNFSPTSRAAAAAAATKKHSKQDSENAQQTYQRRLSQIWRKKLSAWPDEGGEPDLMGPRPAQADVPPGGLS